MRRVIEATWNWRDDAAEARRAAAERAALRRTALVQVAVTALAGVAVLLLLDHQLVARILWIASAVVLVIAIAAPQLYRPVRTFGARVGHAVGVALTYLLLVPFFYLFFAPVGLVLRLLRRDPLHRGGKAPGLSLWIHRREKARDQNVADQFLREDRHDWSSERPAGTVDPRWREPSA
jgi:hypothetical protein